MCLEYVPCSVGDTEKIKHHITTVHCAECNVEKLAEMCGEAEEREEKEGWSLDDIIEKERERREAMEKRRLESRAEQLIKMFRCNSDPVNVESDCFLCKENSNMYNMHLEKKHMIIFGLKEIREYGEEVEKQELTKLVQPKLERIQYNMNPMAMKILVMHSKPHA